MKKIGIIFTALLLFGVGNIYAQTSADVSVSADVQAALTLTVAQNVNFGTIQQAAATLVETSTPGAPTGTNLGAGAQLGVVDIAGSANGSTVITFGDATLSDGAATPNTIAFTTTVQDVTNIAGVTSGDTVTLNGTGDLQLQIGGSLAAPGTTGTFNTTNTGGSPVTITVQYL